MIIQSDGNHTDVAVPAPQPPARLQVTGASKTFAGRRVLSDASLTIQAGEIHALVGQNGSGKSTLIKLMSGFHRPDPGWSMQVDGVPMAAPIAPRSLLAAGVTFVHQDLGLVLDASAVENVRVGRFRAARLTRRVDWDGERTATRGVLARMGADHIDVDAPVSLLDHADRASVAIARAIQGHQAGQGVVVFDESTQSLPREYLHHFYGAVRALADSGAGVLVVSHRLEEVLALCHRVTVLENGRVTVAGQSVAGLDESSLARMIVGARATSSSTAPDRPTRGLGSPRAAVEPTLAVSDLRGGRLTGTSLSIRPGEVVGVTGLYGSGVEQLPYALAGARADITGAVRVGGTTVDLAHATPRTVIDGGLVLVPGRRAEEGLALGLSCLENVSLPRLRERASKAMLSRGWQAAEFHQVASLLGLEPALPDLPAGALSGGNQQKLLVGKWLLNRPTALVLDEPTQAVDVGARQDILAAIRAEADRGTAVLIVSLEAQDLATVCDRVLIVENGRISGEIPGPDLDAARILDRVYGAMGDLLDDTGKDPR